MSKPVIEVRGISKKYRLGTIGATSLREEAERWLGRIRNRGMRKRASEEFWALRDLSFEIQPGEIIGIIGRNGAGKSTLLKILSRITEPTLGEAILRGRVASLLEVGTGFHPELTGRENVFLNGAILGMKHREIKARFSEIVDFAEIGQFIDTPVKRYSSGMYVRLAFAVAAHLQTEILIIDEVLAVGDSPFQEKCLRKVGAMVQDGRTVVLVSHLLKQIRPLASSCLLLEHGKLVTKGETAGVIDTYLSRNDPAHAEAKPSALGAADPICLRQAFCVDPGGKPGRDFHYDQPIVLRMLLDRKEAVGSFHVGISVKDAHDRRIFSDIHKISDVPEQFVLNASLPCPLLAEGSYTFMIVLMDGTGSDLIRLYDHEAPFQIHDSTSKLSPYKGHGCIYAKADWNLS